MRLGRISYVNMAPVFYRLEYEVDDTLGQSHFVFGKIRQTVAALTMRLNWTFSPRLSLQAYAQPFVAAGQYFDMKEFEKPREGSYSIYGKDKGTVAMVVIRVRRQGIERRRD